LKPNIFMSYSRREVGFIDDLTDRLEKAGYKVWLDYRSLVPGSPWATQIQKGVDESQVILLVVSKASIASKYVELEWRRVITEETKRIILLIFEAVDLPPELEKYEWVDFRGNYEAGIRELCSQLDAPIQEEHPAPETGFKVPSIVWKAFALSLLTAFFSVFSLWSLFIPYYLLPLPYRILKRDFNITQVQAALWLLPVVSFLTVFSIFGMEAVSGRNEMIANASLIVAGLSLFVAPVLVFVLRSKGMQRWGKPEASRSTFANPYKPDVLRPSPVSFFIDHAPQDRRVASELTRRLDAHDHPQAETIQSAQAVFVLLSGFKNDSEADPERQTVFPVMIQTCTPAGKLSKVQWIDFRTGVRNQEAVAKLLPDPAKLLTALGVRPTGNQLVLPPVIMSLYYFLILLGIFTLGSLINNWIFSPEGFRSGLKVTLVGLLLMSGLIYLMIRALVHRKGRLASILIFTIAIFGLGLLTFVQFLGPFFIGGDAADKNNLAILFPLVAYAAGVILLALVLTIRFRDVWRWFPAKAPKIQASSLEKPNI
jgi:MFS family permease